MNEHYEHQTSIGPFYIMKHEDCYHAFYAGFSIGSCSSPDELAAVLGYGYKFNLFGAEHCELDTSQLGISPDLSEWKRLPSVKQHSAG